jgi:hypothetical protein
MPRQITGLVNICLGMTVFCKFIAIAYFPLKINEDAVKEAFTVIIPYCYGM